MNRRACSSLFLLLCAFGITSCSSGNNHNGIATITPTEAITATSGTPQSHAVNGTFGAALVATVTTNGAPTSGVTVTFTAPPTLASGTFSNTGSKTADAITDVNGMATSPAITANETAGIYTVSAAVAGAPTQARFSLTNTAGAPVTVIATSGTPQTTGISTGFAAPLAAKVLDGGQNPVSGAIVIFTAPATGASGIFVDTMSNVTTATSNANGVATSATFTANGTSGADTVTATVAGVSIPASFFLTNLAGTPVAIAATSGTPQSAPIDTAFAAPLIATVFDSSSNPVSGVAVTFTAPAMAASGAFANGTRTEVDTTDANGMATSTTFSANGLTGGPYIVSAGAPGLSTPATFSLTNRVASTTYVFYVSGQEAFEPDFYAVAGSVEIDASGNVLAGEQDYNDGGFGFTSPEPSGDTISGGSLTVDGSGGQGTLILNTNNTNLGVGGVETFGVQFVNSNHAQIIEFDGAATSSGSMDLQTLSTLSGGFAFTFSGVDDLYSPVAFGGVFSISGGTTLQNGFVDTNDAGAVTTDMPLTGTLTAPDSFGRGTITSTLNYAGTPIALNYYVVGPEAIRIIDVDPFDSAVGSAFGQGANATSSTNASLGNSVFGVAGSPFPTNYAVAGMFSTSNTSVALASFSGVADDNEVTYGVQVAASPISGTYAVASNGYGSFTITSGDLGDVSVFGVYMTDPNLNLNDPNNTTAGLGGALVAEMDDVLAGGIGIVIPQTDTSTASFAGAYAFGAQAYNDLCCEFDLVGQGSVAGGVLTGTGIVSDPFLTLGANPTNSEAAFSGSPLPDPSNIGRYTMFSTNPTPNPLDVTVGGAPTDFDVVIYQASGGELFWLNEDIDSVFFGSFQQQGSLTGLPAAGKSPVKLRSGQKR
jgi:hypothetical protein